jgi:hypothetical protein
MEHSFKAMTKQRHETYWYITMPKQAYRHCTVPVMLSAGRVNTNTTNKNNVAIGTEMSRKMSDDRTKRSWLPKALLSTG